MSNDVTTKYVFARQAHLGSLRYSFMPGTVFELVKKPSEKYVTLDGEKLTNVSEFETCIKVGIAVPQSSNIKINTEIKTMVKPEKQKKMEVTKSDVDQMKEVIDITDTKNEVIKAKKAASRKAKQDMEVIHEDNTKTVRGLKVVNNDATRKDILGSEINKDSEVVALVNDDAKVIKKIGENSPNKATTEKGTITKRGRKAKSEGTTKSTKSKSKTKEMSPEVKARLEARKKQAQANHEKTIAAEAK